MFYFSQFLWNQQMAHWDLHFISVYTFALWSWDLYLYEKQQAANKRSKQPWFCPGLRPPPQAGQEWSAGSDARGAASARWTLSEAWQLLWSSQKLTLLQQLRLSQLGMWSHWHGLQKQFRRKCPSVTLQVVAATLVLANQRRWHFWLWIMPFIFLHLPCKW